jgi:hypothetical protein
VKYNQNGFAVIELALISATVLIIGGAGVYVVKAKNSANTSYDKAATTSQVNLSKKTSQKPVSQETPAKTVTPPAEPAPDNVTPKPKVVTQTSITHPTKDNCGNSQQSFTVYVSNTKGAQTYWDREFTRPGPTQQYKTKLSIVCDSYTPAGYGVTNDTFIKFSDLSLNPL